FRMKTLLISTLLTFSSSQASQFLSARAILFKSRSGDNPGEMVGTIDFYQEDGKVSVNGTVSGHPAGQHGFHVHEHGDLSNGCLNTGAHYNPYSKSHGAPDASVRHNGDLGNIQTSADGATAVDTRDSYLTLNGPLSIIGRAVVVHEMKDDLGLGGNDASLTTGNAGARVACGVIAVMDEEDSSFSVLSISTFFVTLAYLFSQ
ncbi:hypothetical protein PENTCL1PPCAC_3270, partial [Pristionchus entomophagus]